MDSHPSGTLPDRFYRVNDVTAGPMPPVLLLAGGAGTRLRPLTDTIPKCLVTVAGRPLLDWWHDAFLRAGITEVRINLHAHADRVRRHVEDLNASSTVSSTCMQEPVLLGTAGTVERNLAWLERGEDFLVVYCDNFSTVDLFAFSNAHRAGGRGLTPG